MPPTRVQANDGEDAVRNSDCWDYLLMFDGPAGVYAESDRKDGRSPPALSVYSVWVKWACDIDSMLSESMSSISDVLVWYSSLGS